jgi:hypothetical protein
LTSFLDLDLFSDLDLFPGYSPIFKEKIKETTIQSGEVNPMIRQTLNG